MTFLKLLHEVISTVLKEGKTWLYFAWMGLELITEVKML
jgi:hypothetical protein